MGKQKVKPNYRRRLLRLPGLYHCKRAVLTALVRAARVVLHEPASTSSSLAAAPSPGWLSS
jgi:hypothetical protein